MDKQISELIGMIYSLPENQRQHLFAKEISELEELKAILNKAEDIFNPHEPKAWAALQKIIIFFRKMTGYNCGWVAEEAIERCSNAGRKAKYSPDRRLANSIIIHQISKRGCSDRQAIILLAKIIDDKAVSLESTQRELANSYREFQKKELFRDHEEIPQIGMAIAEMLNFDLSKQHKSDEKAFLKACAAYQAFWQDVVNLMIKYHPILAKYDNGYPKIFGCVIEWLGQNYDNPMEYFYKPTSHQTIALVQRKRNLAAYIDAIGFFLDKTMD